MARMSPELRVALYEIASELDSDNVRGLKFLFGVVSASPHSCCHCSSASRTLDLLEHLHKQGLYRQDNMAPLVEALVEVGRNDLSSRCSGLATTTPPPLLPTDCPLECTEHDAPHMAPPHSPTSPERDAPHIIPPHSSASLEPSVVPDSTSVAHNHTPSFSRASPTSPDSSDSSMSLSPSPSLDLSYSGNQPDSSLHMPVTRTTATPTSAIPTKCWGRFCMRAKEVVLQSPKQLMRRLGKGRSCESPHSDEFVIVEHPLQVSQSFDITMSEEAQARRQSYRNDTPCVSCKQSVSRPHVPRTDTPTFHWILQRMSFVDPIFLHQPKPFTNKFSVTGSQGRSECSLTFALNLYPNGVNWDQDKSASLHVEISGPCGSSPSHAPSSPTHAACTVYLEVVLLEVVGGRGGKMLAYRRQVCRLREKREFLLNNFIPHDVIKNSTAEDFKLLFNVSVSYSLGLDWVWVGDQETRGVMVEL